MAGIKKKVDVVCYRPFKLGIANFSGSCNNITLDADSIQICLENKAMVSEVLKNGKRVPLDFSNFNKKNPMGYDIDSPITEINGPATFTVKNINKTGTQVGTIRLNDDQPPVIVQNGTVSRMDLNAYKTVPTVNPNPATPKKITFNPVTSITPATEEKKEEITEPAPKEEKKEETKPQQSSNNDNKKDDKKNFNNKHHK